MTIVGVLAFAIIVIAQRSKPERSEALVGKFVHTFNAQGQQQFQARVLREDGDRLFVQFYSAEDGLLTNQGYLTNTQRATAKFYDTQADWLAAYRRLNRH